VIIGEYGDWLLALDWLFVWVNNITFGSGTDNWHVLSLVY